MRIFALLLLAGCAADAPADVTGRFSLSPGEDFYAHPWPSDLRLDADGHPEISAMPRADNAELIEPLVRLASEREGWNLLPVAYFQFDGAVAARSASDGALSHDDARAYFIDIDDTSPHRGERIPVVAHRLEPDVWTPENMLAITPAPGQLLRPSTRYAAVIAPSFGDADGRPLAAADNLVALARGEGPPDARETFAPLWEIVAALDVAAATVFTTTDTVRGVAATLDHVSAQYDAELVSLTVDPDDGADHERFCELHAVIRLPQFQRGEPPYDEGGDFVFDDDGAPIVQRFDDVPVSLAIPSTPMPQSGYPLMMYVHGTDGTSDQVIDRGPITTPDGVPVKGLGPAHVVAEHGIAAAGAGVLLGPERVSGAPERAYLRLSNLAAFPYNFQQAAIDLRMTFDFFEDLTIDPSVVSACALAVEESYRFDTSRLLVLGQSSGSHLAAMLGALDPRVRAIAPTGVGGYWSQLLSTGSDVAGSPELFGILIDTEVPLTPLHPANGLLELAWEAGEPLVYAQRVARSPLPEHPARHIYMPAAQNDSYHPEPLYDAMAVAYGVELVGPELWPEMGAALEHAGVQRESTFPVRANVSETTTAVVTQWAGDGIVDSHLIFQQLPEVKHQYGCFFATLIADGIPTVPAPDAPCP